MSLLSGRAQQAARMRMTGVCPHPERQLAPLEAAIPTLPRLVWVLQRQGQLHHPFPRRGNRQVVISQSIAHYTQLYQ